MDVKELLQTKHIDFMSSGRDYLIKCTNPEHEDSNPSMRIDKLTGIYGCFSCGHRGDIFKDFNITKDRLFDARIEQVREKISALSRTSIYLPLDAMPIEKDFRDISKSTLLKFGAFTTDSIPEMEGRIVFPVSNINAQTVGFIGRYMYSDLDPRYKIYPEHTTLPLYPSVVKPIKDSIILVEGIFDMINLHDKGLHNAVCVWSTAFGRVKDKKKKAINLNRLLNYKYQGIDTIFVMFDGDDAGRKAGNSLVNYINTTFNTDTIDLADGQDPGALTKPEIDKIYGELYG